MRNNWIRVLQTSANLSSPLTHSSSSSCRTSLLHRPASSSSFALLHNKWPSILTHIYSKTTSKWTTPTLRRRNLQTLRKTPHNSAWTQAQHSTQEQRTPTANTKPQEWAAKTNKQTKHQSPTTRIVYNKCTTSKWCKCNNRISNCINNSKIW